MSAKTVSLFLACLCFCVSAYGQANDKKQGAAEKVKIPRRQSQPPGPAVPPEQAAKKFTVPEGFSVEVVASEPELLNPVAMAIDERGRFWVTESFEYPRKEAGEGRDRIKILEDTTGDGRCDKVTVFAEGLNIPSGIAVGHGGVWVANSPDILFLQDTDGDDVADSKKVIVTGFGRDDTHELPNSLTWGPDGWLYGLNGVFNFSKIEHMGETHEFTCAMFRINPRPRGEGDEFAGQHDFQVWAEGTSNPWGIAFNDEGDAFLSACVIDHLWHLTESGYYHRQGGPYPPHTWKIGSIVEHAHQMAAYCGIVWLDTDAYPDEFSGRFYMGNIHGGCLNVDVPERRGSTYFATPRDDFMTANDVWHMPVSQQVGPDGSLYVLDWYDRYHCYQDANADPEGVDRAHGRLYRVRYKDTPRVINPGFASADGEQLVALLDHGNVWYRNTAQRLIAEKSESGTLAKLRKLVAEESGLSQRMHRHAVWTLMSSSAGLGDKTARALLASDDVFDRRWAVRAAGDDAGLAKTLAADLKKLIGDSDVRVRQELIIAAAKVDALETVPTISAVLADPGNDEHLAHIAWQNLVPEFEAGATGAFLKSLSATETFEGKAAVLAMMPHFADYLLKQEKPDLSALVQLFDLLRERKQEKLAARCLAALTERSQSGQLNDAQMAMLKEQLGDGIDAVLKDGPEALRLDAALLGAGWKRPAALQAIDRIFRDENRSSEDRARALEALVAGEGAEFFETVANILKKPDGSDRLRAEVLANLGRSELPRVAEVVLEAWPKLTPVLRRGAVELLVQRPAWSQALLAAIEAGKVDSSVVNPMQARSMAAGADEGIRGKVEKLWGAVRTDRNPQREKVIAESRRLLRTYKGDWKKGREVFSRACAACHKLHGEGNLIGPDITKSGRGTLDQLLSNVFDPNLVIGEAYQARVAQMKDGRVIIGLPVEDNDQRLVLRTATGQDETLARDAIEKSEVLKISLMPEGLEATMNEQERVDLLTYLSWDLHPENPDALQLAGFGPPVARQTSDPAEYAALLNDFAPGFGLEAETLKEFGVAIVEDFRGKQGVLRIHPLSQRAPAVLRARIKVEKDGPKRLRLSVSHHVESDKEKGDWRLIVKANGDRLHESWVRADTMMPLDAEWREVSINLSKYAGKEVELEILNQANNWAWEFGYFGGIWWE
jgi:putative membrane-bound dehydrogenase-like protein